MPSPKKKAPALNKIRLGRLLALLESHALGETEMTPSQVNVALALLKLADADLKRPPDKNRKPEATAHEDALRELW